MNGLTLFPFELNKINNETTETTENESNRIRREVLQVALRQKTKKIKKKYERKKEVEKRSILRRIGLEWRRTPEREWYRLNLAR